MGVNKLIRCKEAMTGYCFRESSKVSVLPCAYDKSIEMAHSKPTRRKAREKAIYEGNKKY
jgi:hypothetical protein